MNIKTLQVSSHGPGIVSWISIRPVRVKSVFAVEKILAITNVGLEGDHYSNVGGSRQVTLFQEEHLTTLASFLGKDNIDPSLVRRNILIRGFNLLSLKEKKFKLGNAILEYTGDCHPCSRMEENLGRGGYHAMRGLGGITAKVLEGGEIRIGDHLNYYQLT